MCANSFTGDTYVLMADGSAKRIDEIEVGDKVASSEPESAQSESHEVLAVHISDAEKAYVDLEVATPDGLKRIRATAHHLFYDANSGEWVDAANLKAAGQLNTPENGRAVIESVREYRATLRTFNLSVAELQTFFVLAGATPVLVHNAPPPCRKSVNGWPKQEGGNCEACAKRIQKMIGGKMHRFAGGCCRWARPSMTRMGFGITTGWW
ncbi:Hint domain-containing protein [Saccharothrix obliqua]|uniref:Hint domain-containing protein n=1 Tax=Saccharothrix obliqua TaxID=2861747 RepID=UPI001C5DEC37|nr:Hint domain-containing protein [Saccharothrix obliqua]MBW4717969.1 hypothetical protein [Saccharothrix obliqua]